MLCEDVMRNIIDKVDTADMYALCLVSKHLNALCEGLKRKSAESTLEIYNKFRRKRFTRVIELLEYIGMYGKLWNDNAYRRIKNELLYFMCLNPKRGFVRLKDVKRYEEIVKKVYNGSHYDDILLDWFKELH